MWSGRLSRCDQVPKLALEMLNLVFEIIFNLPTFRIAPRSCSQECKNLGVQASIVHGDGLKWRRRSLGYLSACPKQFHGNGTTYKVKALLVNVFILDFVWEICYKGQIPFQYIYGAEKFFEISRSTALRLSS